MSNYIKKYNVGEIVVDLPYNSFIHELPLFDFNTFRNSFNVSIIYNYQLNQENHNLVNIGNGFKLNIQKKIIKINNKVSKFIESNGKIINLIENFNGSNANNLYTFDDESKRVLRILLNGYEIEHEDLSREVYDQSGNIIASYDKYGDVYLTYTYENGLLKNIQCENNSNQQVTFNYLNNKLASISYGGVNTTFSYSDDSINIYHYSGVNYIITITFDKYTILGSGVEGSETVTHSKECIFSEQNIILNYKIGNDIVDTLTYTFPFYMIEGLQRAYSVDIIDKNQFKQRIQFINNKPSCSYEVNTNANFYSDINNEFNISEDYFLNDVNIYETLDDCKTNKFQGKIKIYDGIRLGKGIGHYHKWETDISSFNSSIRKGYYLLTGWIKSNTPNTNNYISIFNPSIEGNITFNVYTLEENKWYFFAYQFDIQSNRLEIFSDQINFEMRDVRVEFHTTQVVDNNTIINTLFKEDVLIDDSTNEIIPFDKVQFFAVTEGSSINVALTSSDIIRYYRRLNKRQESTDSQWINEICYKNGKNVVNEVLYIEFKIINTGITKMLNNYSIGQRIYKNKKEYITRTKYINYNVAKFLITNSKNNNYYSYQYLDKNYDIIETGELEGSTMVVKGLFERNGSLLTREKMEGLYDINYTYNSDNTIIVKDNYNNSNNLSFGITYYMDPIWGVVYKKETLNGTKVEDTYDDDMSVILQKHFNKQTLGIKHLFSYNKGELTSLLCNDLNYSFEYNKGELVKVLKFNSTIEEQLHNNLEHTIYYPSINNNIYSKQYTYDKYGRLLRINDELENIYSVDNNFHPTTGEPFSQPISNSSAKLIMSEDKLAETKTRYYNANGLTQRVEMTSSSNYEDKVSDETYEYDSVNRLTKKIFAENQTNKRFVIDEITYLKDTEDPLLDERISVYKYSVCSEEEHSANNYEPSIITTYQYDSKKRVCKKIYNIAGKIASQELQYSFNRLDKEINNIGSSQTTKTYLYDSFDRISSINVNNKVISYEYDDYGRLIRENNQPLDRTFIYSYNNIGNIIGSRTYAYTTSTNPATLKSTKLYEYDEINKDKLISYNNANISYNTLGCPTVFNDYTITWNKGRLVRLFKGSLKEGTEEYIYSYNAYGQRVSKKYTKLEGTDPFTAVAFGVVTEYDKKYVYDNLGRLIREYGSTTYFADGTYQESIEYIYDANNIIGMIYKKGSEVKKYYFERNIFGDVEAIYDSNCALKVKYLYDAYGNCTIANETTDTVLAHINPIRYRGYYYDVETGWFWLSSRYYSPELCRFISPDDVEYLDPESVNGLNLYCYCKNNPIMYADPSGHFVVSALIIGAIVGACIGFGTAIYIDYQDDGQIFNGSVAWYDYLGATVLGGVAGAAIGAGLGAFAGMSFSATLPTGFAMVQTTAGTTALVATGSMTLTVTGAQVLSAAGLVGTLIMFSKHNKGMSNKPPFSWTTNQEGIEAMTKFGGNAKKAADYIMNNHFDNWKYGSGQPRNAIHKWLDRVIREILGM